MSKIIVVSALVTAILGGAWLATRTQRVHSESSRARSERTPQVIPLHPDRGRPALDGVGALAVSAFATAQLHSELAGLKAQVKDLRSELNAQIHTADATEMPTAPPATPDELSAVAQAWNEGYISTLEQTLLEEEVDRGWAREAEVEARSTLAPQGSGRRVLSIDCRATLCRLEVAHDDLQGHETLLAGVNDQFTWNGPAILMPVEEDGESRTVVFLAREGQVLPAAESDD